MTFKFKFLFITPIAKVISIPYDLKLLINFTANPSVRTWISLRYKSTSSDLKIPFNNWDCRIFKDIFFIILLVFFAE